MKHVQPLPLTAEAQPALVVRPLQEGDEAAWNAFVEQHANGTFFHLAGWARVFKNVFRLEPRYILALRGGEIVGVLPLVHQRSLLFGNALLSTPFCVQGGPLAADIETDLALTAAAVQIQEETKAPYLEFRSKTTNREGWGAIRNLYAVFSGPISGDMQQNLLAIPRKQRAVVRKTLTSDLKSELAHDVDTFFRVYSESVRNLGTPVFGKRYFRALKDEFGSSCDIVIVSDADAPVSAVLNFYFKDAVLPYYGGGTTAARKNGANDFLYWEVIRYAAARGYHRFDFGRSKAGTGAFAFKKNWGFEPKWLEYEFHLRPGESPPDKNPLNPKYSLLVETWKRLPLPLANLIGPMLVRGLG